MTTFVVDASLWVARLIPKDIFHQIVNEWMDEQKVSGARFLAPALLLSEIGIAWCRCFFHSHGRFFAHPPGDIR